MHQLTHLQQAELNCSRMKNFPLHYVKRSMSGLKERSITHGPKIARFSAIFHIKFGQKGHEHIASE